MHRHLLIGPLLAVLGLVPALEAAEEPVPTVAHIRLAGSLDEAPVPDDPIFGASGENFRAKLERIRKAKSDSAVKALYLQIDGINVGWGKLDELRRALVDFRKSGKKAHAYLESGESKAYLLALACDEVTMPPSGWLMLTGLRAEVSFYKGLFDKVGITADMMQMGEFKGAAEPYTRTGMSPPFRKQFESVLDDYFEKGLVEAIVAARTKRQWTSEKVKKWIDGGPYTAKGAADLGLIDRVAYADTLDDLFKADLKAEKIKIVKNYARAKSRELNLANPFELLKLLAPSKPEESKKAKVAVIFATGVITTGRSGVSLLGGESCGSTTMIEAIRQAESDSTVKAIVLRVDSPGGSALASDLIWNELARCKKPVVASMSDTAASGGYYISMAARKIYADPGTMTGSIGVVGGKIVIGGLENKVGLNTEVITRGANANIFSTTHPFSDSERKAMRALMEDTYEQFLTKALAGRKKAGVAMSREKLESLAGGRIWTGRQAKANGLIDELGTLDEAIAAARTMAGVPEGDQLEILQLPRPRPLLDTLLESREDAALRLPSATLLRDVPELSGKLRGLDALLRLKGEPVWAVLPCRIDVR
jgi:protease-4